MAGTSLRIYLLIFFTKIECTTFLNYESNLKLIPIIIETFNILEVFVLIPEKDVAQVILNSLKDVSNITFNIHSENIKYSKLSRIYHHNQELLILSSKCIEFYNILKNYFESRLIILISFEDKKFIIKNRNFIGYSNTIVFQNHSMIKFKASNNEFINISSINDVLATDFSLFPEMCWPFLSTKSLRQSDDWFPLLVNLEDRFSGIFGYLAYAFKDHINARIKRRDDTWNIHRSERNIKFEFNVFSLVGYPLFSRKDCFMLPIVDEISMEEYLRKAFNNFIWLLILLFILYLSIMLRTCIYKDTFLCIFECITITCGSVHKGLTFQGFRKRFIYINLFLYGFIIWNIYSAKTSSFLSTTNRGTLLKNLDDIRSQKLILWASILYLNEGELFEQAFKYVYFYKKILGDLFNHKVPRDIFNQHLYSLNNSYGYLISDYIWNHLCLYQSLLKRKTFSLSYMCPEQGFIYPISINYGNIFKIQEGLEIFYMKVLEGGFDYIWQQFTYYDIKFKVLKPDFESFIVLGFKYFETAWYILFLGISFGILVFIGESINFLVLYKKARIIISKICRM